MVQITTNSVEEENKIAQPERALEQIPASIQSHISVDRWNLLTLEQRDMLRNIEKLPIELMGVVPETVWETLGIDQKFEFIYTHKILERDQAPGVEQARESTEEAGFTDFRHQVEGDITQAEPEINIASPDNENVHELGQQFETIKEEISSIERESGVTGEVAEQLEPVEQDQQFIQPENVDEIQKSSGATFSENPMPKFAGYQPEESFLSTVESTAKGDPGSGDTWVANIIAKFWSGIASN